MNYWVVGASWGGVEHQDEKFVAEGYWMLGWEQEDQPGQYEKASQVKVGDRIAIKRMLGGNQTGIRILHIGVVKGVILDTNKIICTVNWAATGLDRVIDESRGCFRSIHGPYHCDDAWVKLVFCL